MRCTLGLVWASLSGLALSKPAPKANNAAIAAAAYFDQETGFTFSETKVQYTLSNTVTVRTAVPQGVPAGQPFDIVIQFVAESSRVAWAGLAFGGNMVRNPLVVGYMNGQKATLGGRWATGHSTPQPYPTAQFTLLSAGQKSNATHWQYTVKCTGCTSWTGSSGNVRLSPTGSASWAFAWSPTRPSQPSSPTSSIPMHENFVYFRQDLAAGANANFVDLLGRNGISDGGSGGNGSVVFEDFV
ncbi:CBD9-like protein [Corynespora cassiicola Philippines]|uniref:CBD9-like protein n=1 Tax=Corynespora cassiicola Philippines TaxID=1448308 RepID=A0A2T2NYC1_CORCC|nr:CBD9-like protein [Corynespora cassiicola Philippines]